MSPTIYAEVPRRPGPCRLPIQPHPHGSQHRAFSPHGFFLATWTRYHILSRRRRQLLHATNTRPDVSYSTGVVTRYTSAPRESHLKAMLHIRRCLKGSSTMPSTISDSDYLGDLDKRYTTSGYLFSIGSGPTSWRSHLHGEVAQSSSQAEYRAQS